MNKLLASLLAVVSINAMALGDQQIVNPLTGVGVWVLSQRDCRGDQNRGTIYSRGKEVGCWWTNLVAENQTASVAHFLVGNQYYVYSTSELQDASEAGDPGLRWQTIQEITKPYNSPPPNNTYYYSPNGNILWGTSY